jgi:hypothetical protein
LEGVGAKLAESNTLFVLAFTAASVESREGVSASAVDDFCKVVFGILIETACGALGGLFSPLAVLMTLVETDASVAVAAASADMLKARKKNAWNNSEI